MSEPNQNRAQLLGPLENWFVKCGGKAPYVISETRGKVFCADHERRGKVLGPLGYVCDIHKPSHILKMATLITGNNTSWWFLSYWKYIKWRSFKSCLACSASPLAGFRDALGTVEMAWTEPLPSTVNLCTFPPTSSNFFGVARVFCKWWPTIHFSLWFFYFKTAVSRWWATSSFTEKQVPALCFSALTLLPFFISALIYIGRITPPSPFPPFLYFKIIYFHQDVPKGV